MKINVRLQNLLVAGLLAVNMVDFCSAMKKDHLPVHKNASEKNISSGQHRIRTKCAEKGRSSGAEKSPTDVVQMTEDKQIPLYWHNIKKIVADIEKCRTFQPDKFKEAAAGYFSDLYKNIVENKLDCVVDEYKNVTETQQDSESKKDVKIERLELCIIHIFNVDYSDSISLQIRISKDDNLALSHALLHMAVYACSRELVSVIVDIESEMPLTYHNSDLELCAEWDWAFQTAKLFNDGVDLPPLSDEDRRKISELSPEDRHIRLKEDVQVLYLIASARRTAIDLMVEKREDLKKVDSDLSYEKKKEITDKIDILNELASDLEVAFYALNNVKK